MNCPTQDHILLLLEEASFDEKSLFISRVQEGALTRDENPTSHFCIYFAVYDPALKLVFIGRHKKSGLWLFNGGHIEKDESLEDTLYREMNEEWGMQKKIDIDAPSLFTRTQIENPKKQTCKWHYDIWYFIPFHKDEFHPDKTLLLNEFSEWGWKTIKEARLLARDNATLKGINYISTICQ